jgi:hypothetical protein
LTSGLTAEYVIKNKSVSGDGHPQQPFGFQDLCVGRLQADMQSRQGSLLKAVRH